MVVETSIYRMQAEFEGTDAAVVVVPPTVLKGGDPSPKGSLVRQRVLAVTQIWREGVAPFRAQISQAIARLATCVRDEGYVAVISFPARVNAQDYVGQNVFYPCEDLVGIHEQFAQMAPVRFRMTRELALTLLHVAEGFYQPVVPYGKEQSIPYAERRLGLMGFSHVAVRWHLWKIVTERANTQKELRRLAKLQTEPPTREEEELFWNIATPARFHRGKHARDWMVQAFVKRLSYENSAVIVYPKEVAYACDHPRRRLLTTGEELWDGKTPSGEWLSEWAEKDSELQDSETPM